MVFILDIVAYIILGACSGLLSGLLGIGGGIIVVPALVVILQHNPLFKDAHLMHISVGTSLATMVMTSLSSALAYQRHHALVWPIFWRMLPGLCGGLVAGKLLTTHLSNDILAHILAVFLVLIAAYLFWNAQHSPRTTAPNVLSYSNAPFTVKHPWLLVAASAMIGVLSTLVGVGGGVLMVPLFLMMNLSIREASGTSVLCGIVTALTGALLLSMTPLQSPLPGMIGYIYWPAALGIASSSFIFAPLGTRLAYALNPIMLKRLFSILLILSAWNLLRN